MAGIFNVNGTCRAERHYMVDLNSRLKPIINGSGNYYIESRTRNMKRTDVIMDYKGIQEALEMKIWHGQEYNKRGENQLLEYLDYYHLQKGYMLSFNFNKKTGWCKRGCSRR